MLSVNREQSIHIIVSRDLLHLHYLYNQKSIFVEISTSGMAHSYEIYSDSDGIHEFLLKKVTTRGILLALSTNMNPSAC